MTEEQCLALTALSALLRYPDEQLHNFVREDDTVHMLAELCPEAAVFAQALGATDIVTAQQAYVQAFDMDAGCSLHLAWHVYGDSPCLGRGLAALLGTIQRRRISAPARRNARFPAAHVAIHGTGSRVGTGNFERKIRPGGRKGREKHRQT